MKTRQMKREKMNIYRHNLRVFQSRRQNEHLTMQRRRKKNCYERVPNDKLRPK